MRVASLLRRSAAALALLLATCIASQSFAQQVVPRPHRRGRKYRVRIDSAPQQAAIYLDDVKYGIVGYTPWAGRLEKGNWTVIIKKDGYEVTTRTMTVKRSRRVQETFVPMTRKVEPGVVEVRADADKNAFGADVWVDGQIQGKVPITVKVGDGRHLVEIKKPEYDPFSQWVQVKEGERVEVNPMLKGAARGSLLVDADVPDAEIWLDGNKYTDKTPTLIPNVPEGPHVLEVRKEPALPWRQTVQVEKDKTVKVTAQLKATLAGQGGQVRVISDVKGAHVFLDGTDMGAAPLDVKDVKPGDHVFEVRARGYASRDERVKVNAGSAVVLKLDLNKGAGGAMIKVVSPTPEAEVFIDGEKIGTVPQSHAVSPGEHYVVVSKAGLSKFEKKVQVKAGAVATITAELKAVGGLRFVSTPEGADVELDGNPVGRTPMVRTDLPVGEHVVTVHLKGYYDFESGVKIASGKTGVIQAKLQVIDTGPTAAQLEQEQRGLTAWGADALPTGRSTMAAGIGYPYFANLRFMVGIGKINDMFKFDAGITYRTYGTRWELMVSGRSTLFSQGPFALGAFADVGGGSTYFDDSKRNSAMFNLGAMASLTGLGAATVTGRVYLDGWSDRHCPGLTKSGGFPKSTPTDVCQSYLDGSIDPALKGRVDELLGGDGKIFDRDNGVRVMTSLAIELAIQQHWSVWLLVEGAPRQGERAAYTDAFHSSLFETDPRSYITAGGTYKF